MNAEDRKRLEKVKTIPTLNNCEKEWNWLIAHLEAEAAEVQRLQQRERDLIGRNDIDVHEGMAWCDRAKAAEHRADTLEAECRRLTKILADVSHLAGGKPAEEVLSIIRSITKPWTYALTPPEAQGREEVGRG